ncbi:hypothetical protein ACC691_38480, partial [Rhizobium johnstonii]|uniref:hypothetical protein n=1 Tax=Rhizobium johnstonii TaxID=3019933 RepID=UPI003F98CF62
MEVARPEGSNGTDRHEVLSAEHRGGRVVRREKSEEGIEGRLLIVQVLDHRHARRRDACSAEL